MTLPESQRPFVVYAFYAFLGIVFVVCAVLHYPFVAGCAAGTIIAKVMDL